MKLLTRGSTLALVQTERVASSLRFLGIDVDIERVSTKGDRDTISPLCSFGGSGAFSSCIEEALLRGMGDGAVHSLKDLPSCCREGLEIAAVCPRDSVEDLLLCREEQNLENLPRGAVVGTSSPRRRAQLLRRRPDLSVRELRGNVATRLQKLHDGLYDAIVLAHAGLERLDIRTPNTTPLPFLPAPCQGIIALEAPLNGALFPLGERITDRETHLCSIAERSLLRTLGVGCHVPFAALAELHGETMLLRAEILECDGRDSVSLTFERTVGTDEEALDAGRSLGGLFRNEPRAARLLKACAVPPPPRKEERTQRAGGPSVCTAALAGGDLR
ncbi:MAG: hydroxymethylbilane synthase [Synergistaceae bacterium]|jgi:hydroxymethylbilane synthase|nr:hydroxymethylbilane synthase [Synergistaceae bacterium]